METDLTPFLPETWSGWFGGIPREEFLTLDSRISPRDKMILMKWLQYEGMCPEDVVNAMTLEEREAVLRVWRYRIATSGESGTPAQTHSSVEG